MPISDRVNVRVGNAPVIEGIVIRQLGLGSPRYLVSVARTFKSVLSNQLSHAPLSG